VIDSGLARVASHSNWSGLSRLQTRPVSRASGVQRAGRAGRTAPGRCIRLYSKFDFDGRPMFEVPEIQRADLAQTVLELRRLGVEDVVGFPWFEHPGESSLRATESLLFRLGALSAEGRLTDLGRKLVEWPAPPRLGRLVYECAMRGAPGLGARLAAVLSEARLSDLGPDWLSRVAQGRGDFGGSIRRMEERLLHAVERDTELKRERGPGSLEQILAQSLLRAFPDRVSRKRQGQKPGSVELVLSSGGSASIDHTGEVAHGEYFLALDAEERKAAGQSRAEIRVQSVCAIEPEWLFDLEPEQVSERDELSWDGERGRLESRYQMRFDALVLEESVQSPRDREAAARVFARALLEHRNAQHFGKICEPESLVNLGHRLGFLRAQSGLVDPGLLPELGDSAQVEELLARMAGERFSIGEMAGESFPQFVVDQLEPESRAALDRHAPEFVQLPGGRRCRIHYEADQPPWIESRLQDFFGMSQGPAIAGGRVPLTLHLLAPNMRAVQVTKDLAGFWQRVYPELRRELGRRYPRHKWPEDPLKALPPEPKGR